jgi:deoxycytidylate deaminase
VNADNRIISTGYNGMPNGCNDDVMPWGKHQPDRLKNKQLYGKSNIACFNFHFYDVLGHCSKCKMIYDDLLNHDLLSGRQNPKRIYME